VFLQGNTLVTRLQVAWGWLGGSGTLRACRRRRQESVFLVLVLFLFLGLFPPAEDEEEKEDEEEVLA
jgi:hypothetical protein